MEQVENRGKVLDKWTWIHSATGNLTCRMSKLQVGSHSLKGSAAGSWIHSN